MLDMNAVCDQVNLLEAEVRKGGDPTTIRFVRERVNEIIRLIADGLPMTETAEIKSTGPLTIHFDVVEYMWFRARHGYAPDMVRPDAIGFIEQLQEKFGS